MCSVTLFSDSSCLLSCCAPNALKRCCSLCLSHPFTHSRSCCPFPLARSFTPSLSKLSTPLPQSTLLSPVIIFLHHRLRVCIVLQPQSVAYRVQPLEGGFLYVCIRWSSQMATPSTLIRKPLLFLLSSFHQSFISALFFFPSSFLPPLRAFLHSHRKEKQHSENVLLF